MPNLDCDLQACLSVQPKRSYPAPSKKTQELATELLSLVNDDSARAIAIIQEIMYYSPNRSVDWYYERTIKKITLLTSTRASIERSLYTRTDR